MTSISAKPIVLITGANTGIGLEVVKALCKSSTAYEILLGSRSVQKGEGAITSVKSEIPNTSSTLTVVQVDLESDESIQKAADHVASTFGKVDILVNNAGAALDFQAKENKMTTRDLWNSSWNINVSGTQVLTELFVPLLLKSDSPRLIFMTSGTASLTETESTEGPMLARLNGSPDAGWPKTAGFNNSAYRTVKTGLNMMMREWRRILKNDNVKVWAISPGFLATGLGGVGSDVLKQMGAKDPSEGGRFTLEVIEGKWDHVEGKAIRATHTQPW